MLTRVLLRVLLQRYAGCGNQLVDLRGQRALADDAHDAVHLGDRRQQLERAHAEEGTQRRELLSHGHDGHTRTQIIPYPYMYSPVLAIEFSFI